MAHPSGLRRLLHPARERRVGWFHLIFFASGAAALVYEVVWTRALADVVGSTATALAAVLAVFLSGLAAGAFLIGRSRARGAEALRRYALVEVAVAVSSLIASGILLRRGTALVPLISGSPGGEVVGVVMISAGLLVGPTVLMGGSLPLLLQAAVPLGSARGGRDRAVLLYAWNTLGGALGAVATGYLLIWRLGLSGTVGVAALLNLAAAGGAWSLRKRLPATDWPTTGSGDGAPVAESSARPRASWLLLAGAGGAATLAFEVLWGRLARWIVGERTMALSAVLGVFIAALGAGALLAPVLARRFAPDEGRVRVLAAGFLTAGATVHAGLLPLAAATVGGGGLAPWFVGWPAALGQLAQGTLLMGPPVLLLGLVFPLLLHGARALPSHPGRTVGALYLVNTAAAVAGASVATFSLVGAFGTVGSFIGLTAVTGGVGALGLMTWGGRGARAFAVTSCVLAAGVLAVAWPRLPVVRAGETLVALHEDAYGIQTLTRSPEGLLRLRNNRVSLVFDLGHPETTRAQQMAAHLAVLLGGDPRRVLNLGTGYGITAGTFTLYDSVERVRTVELLPFVLEQQEAFAAYNFRYLGDPRVTAVQGDGRHDLLAGDALWDVVSVNVLDPYLPGSASLYTVEFWEAARERLAPGGVFTQLFWGSDVGLLVRGITQVFPRVVLVPEYGGTSYTVVAFRDGGEDPAPALGRLTPRAGAAVSAVLGAPPEESIPRLLAEAAQVTRRLLAESRAVTGPLHTDDRPVLEYRWAHHAPGVSPFDSPLVVY